MTSPSSAPTHARFRAEVLLASSAGPVPRALRQLLIANTVGGIRVLDYSF